DYYQLVPTRAMKRIFSPKLNDTDNVTEYIQGEELPNEYIVISAHYDHIGMANGEIFNGADDNASGTTATMVLAKLFQQAKIDGHGPKRSIIFLHCTCEEYGFHGSRYFANNPLVPLNQI